MVSQVNYLRSLVVPSFLLSTCAAQNGAQNLAGEAQRQVPYFANDIILHSTISNVGDINGDGVHEVMLGAVGRKFRADGVAEPRIESIEGYVCVLNSVTGELILELTPPVEALHDGRWFGFAVSGRPAGETGSDALLVGAPYMRESGETGASGGRVYLYSQKSGELMGTIESPEGDPSFGYSVLIGPDADGDGVADIAVGSCIFSKSEAGACGGSVSLFSGVGHSLIFKVDGLEPGARFGASLIRGDDFDADGREDFIVGAPYGVAEGLAVISGHTGERLLSVAGRAGGFGSAICLADDFDGNGMKEFLVGAPHAGASESGVVYVVSGEQGTVIDNCDGWLWSQFGASVAYIGEADSPGTPVFCVGAPGFGMNPSVSEQGGLEADAGRVMVVSSEGCTQILSIDGAADNERFGSSLCFIQDAKGKRICVTGHPIDGSRSKQRRTALLYIIEIGS